MVALREREARPQARVGLFLVLDAFRQGLHQQLARGGHQRGHQALARHRRRLELGDEAAVELQVVGRRLGQLEEPGLARAEVVVGEADVDLEQAVAQPRDEVGLGQGALVDLEHQVHVGRERAQLLERLEQPRPLELHRVRVHEQHRRLGQALDELHRLAPEQPAELGLHVGAEGTRQVEQLHRALGQVGIAPAAERLVGRHARAGQRHDRLEVHRDGALVDQLAHLERAGDEVAAERRRVQDRAVGPGAVLLGHLARDAELVVAHVQHVAVVERTVLHALAVQERAVAAVLVADPQRQAVGVDLGVELRHVVRLQHELQARPAPDAEGQGLERGALERAVLADLALEHPHAQGAGRSASLGQPVPQLRRFHRAELPRVVPRGEYRYRCSLRAHASSPGQERAIPGPAGRRLVHKHLWRRRASRVWNPVAGKALGMVQLGHEARIVPRPRRAR